MKWPKVNINIGNKWRLLNYVYKFARILWQGRLTVHLDNTMIVGQKFFKKWGKLLLIYHSIEAAKARKKRRLLTQSKPAILVSLCGKNPQNNGSAVYENLAYFSEQNWSAVCKICKRVHLCLWISYHPKSWTPKQSEFDTHFIFFNK